MKDIEEFEEPTMYILPLDRINKSKYDVHHSDDDGGWGPLEG